MNSSSLSFNGDGSAFSGEAVGGQRDDRKEASDDLDADNGDVEDLPDTRWKKRRFNLKHGRVNTDLNTRIIAVNSRIDTVLSSNNNRIDSLSSDINARLGTMDNRLNAMIASNNENFALLLKSNSEAYGKLERQIEKLDAKIDKVDTKIGTQIAKLDAKIDKVDTKIGTQIDKLDTKIDKVDSELKSLKTDVFQTKVTGVALIAILVMMAPALNGIFSSLGTFFKFN